MPTLFRLLTILALIAGIIYGIMAALVYFVEPTRTELTIDVPLKPLIAIAPKRPAEPEPTFSEGSSQAVPPTVAPGEGDGEQ
ncbi:hypothetical protein U0C82_01550 [Fulvimarina sp. 2208YS6-2-32]|uniref:Histidine kinase n=1 Tax=Fulvimarina uroteuthidis TaxID=3098149 RepID=A0ABU5HY72_9HYPH|nr:hypothetical protein [Fulvimarina sp. 2208YS6-2-32]MDY8107832.1 hypothetical protein [Fulvimarina sp. 2208YS6-2-32]